MYVQPIGTTIIVNGGTFEGDLIVSEGASFVMADDGSLENPESSSNVTSPVVPIGKEFSLQGDTGLDLSVAGTFVPKNCSLNQLNFETSIVEKNSVLGTARWDSSNDILKINEALTATDEDGDSTDPTQSNFNVENALGHLGIPSNIDDSTFQKTNLITVVRNADLSTFEAHRSGDAELTIRAAFGSNHQLVYSYAVEKQSGGNWVLIDDDLTTNPAIFSTSIAPGQTWIRTFDGNKFLYDYIWSVLGTSMDVISMCVKNETNADYFVLSKIVAPTAVVRTKQTVTMLAQVCKSSSASDALLNDWNDNITSVSYTCYKVTQSGSGIVRTAVAGHENVSVTTDCVSDSVATSKLWTGSNFGYNFSMTPATRTSDLFPEPGTYEIEVEIQWKDTGGTTQTPITFSNSIDVLI